MTSAIGYVAQGMWIGVTDQGNGDAYGPRLFVTQDLQHALRRLFLGVYPVDEFAVLVVTDDDVFGRGDEAVLDAPVAADLVLVGAGVEKSHIERLAVVEFRKKYLIDVLFRIVIIVAVAGDATQDHA